MSGSHTTEPVSRFSAQVGNGSSPSIINVTHALQFFVIHSNVHVRMALSYPGANYSKYEQKFYEQKFPTFHKPNPNY